MLIQSLGNGLYGGSYQGRYTVVDGNKLKDEDMVDSTGEYIIHYTRRKNPHLEVIKKLLYSYENN